MLFAGIEWMHEEKLDPNCRIAKRMLAMQCFIDSLMLEYCPGEMTYEQMEEWSKHQKLATELKDERKT